jgi:hypothetical protein
MMVTSDYFETLGQSSPGRFFPREEDEEQTPAQSPCSPRPVVAAVRPDRRSSVRRSPERRAFTVVASPPRFTGTTLSVRVDLFVPMSMQPHFMPGSGNRSNKAGWIHSGQLEPG